MKGLIVRQDMLKSIEVSTKTNTRRLANSHINENPDDWTLVGGQLGYVNDAAATDWQLPKSRIGQWAACFQHKKGWYHTVFPRFQPKEIAYLKEPFLVTDDLTIYKYRDGSDENLNYKSPRHMPASEARFFIRIKSVRCQRLWDISNADAAAEGVESGYIYQMKELSRSVSKGLNQTSKFQIIGMGTKVALDYTTINLPSSQYFQSQDESQDRYAAPDQIYRASFFTLWQTIHSKESLQLNPWVFAYQFELTPKPKL